MFTEWLGSQTDEFRPHSPSMIVQGTLLLWPTWLFFNGGSADIFAPRANGPAKIIINNMISASMGGLVAVIVKPRFLK